MFDNLCCLGSPVNGNSKKGEEKQGQDAEDVVETGVRNGTGFVTTKSALIRPVQSTVGIGVTALATDGDTSERGAETIEEKHHRGDGTDQSSEAKIKLVIDIGSFECVDLCAEYAGQIQNIEERHGFLILK